MQAAIKARGRHDLPFFARYHFDLTTDLSDWQRDMLAEPQPGAREAWTTCRGGGKTTLAQIRLIHGLCYGLPWAKFILYASASSELAIEKVSDIAEQLQERDTLLALFGNPFPRTPGRGEFETAWGQRVIAMGVGEKFRGRLWHGTRPTAVVMDDIEGGEEETSQAGRRRR